MTTYKQWYDRIDNLLKVMKANLQLDTISVVFTRRELIELKLIIDTCAILSKEVARDERN